MKRREFMRLSGVTAGGVAATGTAAAQTNGSGDGSGSGANGTNSSGASGGNASGGNASANGSGGGGGGPTETVQVGPGGQLVFEPAEIQIPTGGTIRWVWESGGHNVVPEEGDWGHEPLENAGFTYEHTFEQAGEQSYICTPHEAAGMVGTVTVGSGSGGGAAEQEVDPEEMGVPIQAHFVGIATILMMILSLGYSFFLLKYGESPNAKGGNN